MEEISLFSLPMKGNFFKGIIVPLLSGNCSIGTNYAVICEFPDGATIYLTVVKESEKSTAVIEIQKVLNRFYTFSCTSA